MKRWLAVLPVLCAAAFPLHPRATTPVLILWLLVVVWSAWRPPRDERPKERPFAWWAPLVQYAFIALWLLVTEDLEAGLFALEVKISLLLMPLLWGQTTRWVHIPRSHLAKGLFAGLAISALASGADALWSSVMAGDHSGWRYAELSGALHPTYAAWYWSMGVVLWLSDAGRERSSGGAVLAGVMLGLLASKAGWIAGLAAFAAAFGWGGHRRAAVLGAAALLVAGFAVGQGRALEWLEGMQTVAPSEVAAEVSSAERTPSGSTAGRLQSWNAAWSVMWQHPLGVGSGDVRAALVAEYESVGADYAAQHRMNAHSVFFETGVAFGWLGLLWLMGWWGTVFVVALRRRDVAAVAFVALSAWMGLTESTFELQSGVVWMAFGFWAWGPMRRVN
jgi:hypothetical protein